MREPSHYGPFLPGDLLKPPGNLLRLFDDGRPGTFFGNILSDVLFQSGRAFAYLFEDVPEKVIRYWYFHQAGRAVRRGTGSPTLVEPPATLSTAGYIDTGTAGTTIRDTLQQGDLCIALPNFVCSLTGFYCKGLLVHLGGKNLWAGHFNPFFTRTGQTLFRARPRLFVVRRVCVVATCIVWTREYVAHARRAPFSSSRAGDAISVQDIRDNLATAYAILYVELVHATHDSSLRGVHDIRAGCAVEVVSVDVGIADGLTSAQFRALSPHGSLADLRSLVFCEYALHLIVHLPLRGAVEAFEDKDRGNPGLLQFLGYDKLVDQFAGHPVGVVEDYDVIEAI